MPNLVEVKGKRLARASPLAADCVRCPKFPDCDELAVAIDSETRQEGVAAVRMVRPTAYALSFIGAASANRSVSPRTTSTVTV